MISSKVSAMVIFSTLRDLNNPRQQQLRPPKAPAGSHQEGPKPCETETIPSGTPRASACSCKAAKAPASLGLTSVTLTLVVGNDPSGFASWNAATSVARYSIAAPQCVPKCYSCIVGVN